MEDTCARQVEFALKQNALEAVSVSWHQEIDQWIVGRAQFVNTLYLLLRTAEDFALGRISHGFINEYGTLAVVHWHRADYLRFDL